jgi:DNA/RNA-binding domain of Phe-tRNA-synthetase-like protein
MNPGITLSIDPSIEAGRLRAALVWASGLPGSPATSAPSAYLSDLLSRVRASGEAFLAPERKTAVRNMLRHGKYKPAGRAKPSSEYLLAAALEGEAPMGGFPLVNGPVDANNAASLAWGYPASIFDTAKCGRELLLRWGQPGESYVFNLSGQVIDLEDLLVACRRRADGTWEACGNPVKDAMATKVFEDCREVAAVVYAPASDPRSGLEACAGAFAGMLRTECKAADAGWSIVG